MAEENPYPAYEDILGITLQPDTSAEKPLNYGSSDTSVGRGLLNNAPALISEKIKDFIKDENAKKGKGGTTFNVAKPIQTKVLPDVDFKQAVGEMLQDPKKGVDINGVAKFETRPGYGQAWPEKLSTQLDKLRNLYATGQVNIIGTDLFMPGAQTPYARITRQGVVPLEFKKDKGTLESIRDLATLPISIPYNIGKNLFTDNNATEDEYRRMAFGNKDASPELKSFQKITNPLDDMARNLRNVFNPGSILAPEARTMQLGSNPLLSQGIDFAQGAIPYIAGGMYGAALAPAKASPLLVASMVGAGTAAATSPQLAAQVATGQKSWGNAGAELLTNFVMGTAGTMASQWALKSTLGKVLGDKTGKLLDEAIATKNPSILSTRTSPLWGAITKDMALQALVGGGGGTVMSGIEGSENGALFAQKGNDIVKQIGEQMAIQGLLSLVTGLFTKGRIKGAIQEGYNTQIRDRIKTQTDKYLNLITEAEAKGIPPERVVEYLKTNPDVQERFPDLDPSTSWLGPITTELYNQIAPGQELLRNTFDAMGVRNLYNAELEARGLPPTENPRLNAIFDVKIDENGNPSINKVDIYDLVAIDEPVGVGTVHSTEVNIPGGQKTTFVHNYEQKIPEVKRWELVKRKSIAPEEYGQEKGVSFTPPEKLPSTTSNAVVKAVSDMVETSPELWKKDAKAFNDILPAKDGKQDPLQIATPAGIESMLKLWNKLTKNPKPVEEYTPLEVTQIVTDMLNQHYPDIKPGRENVHLLKAKKVATPEKPWAFKAAEAETGNLYDDMIKKQTANGVNQVDARKNMQKIFGTDTREKFVKKYTEEDDIFIQGVIDKWADATSKKGAEEIAKSEKQKIGGYIKSQLKPPGEARAEVPSTPEVPIEPPPPSEGPIKGEEPPQPAATNNEQMRAVMDFLKRPADKKKESIVPPPSEEVPLAPATELKTAGDAPEVPAIPEAPPVVVPPEPVTQVSNATKKKISESLPYFEPGIKVYKDGKNFTTKEFVGATKYSETWTTNEGGRVTIERSPIQDFKGVKIVQTNDGRYKIVNPVDNTMSSKTYMDAWRASDDIEADNFGTVPLEKSYFPQQILGRLAYAAGTIWLYNHLPEEDKWAAEVLMTGIVPGFVKRPGKRAALRSSRASAIENSKGYLAYEAAALRSGKSAVAAKAEAFNKVQEFSNKLDVGSEGSNLSQVAHKNLELKLKEGPNGYYHPLDQIIQNNIEAQKITYSKQQQLDKANLRVKLQNPDDVGLLYNVMHIEGANYKASNGAIPITNESIINTAKKVAKKLGMDSNFSPKRTAQLLQLYNDMRTTLNMGTKFEIESRLPKAGIVTDDIEAAFKSTEAAYNKLQEGIKNKQIIEEQLKKNPDNAEYQRRLAEANRAIENQKDIEYKYKMVKQAYEFLKSSQESHYINPFATKTAEDTWHRSYTHVNPDGTTVKDNSKFKVAVDGKTLKDMEKKGQSYEEKYHIVKNPSGNGFIGDAINPMGQTIDVNGRPTIESGLPPERIHIRISKDIDGNVLYAKFTRDEVSNILQKLAKNQNADPIKASEDVLKYLDERIEEIDAVNPDAFPNEKAILEKAREMLKKDINAPIHTLLDQYYRPMTLWGEIPKKFYLNEYLMTTPAKANEAYNLQVRNATNRASRGFEVNVARHDVLKAQKYLAEYGLLGSKSLTDKKLTNLQKILEQARYNPIIMDTEKINMARKILNTLTLGLTTRVLTANFPAAHKNAAQGFEPTFTYLSTMAGFWNTALKLAPIEARTIATMLRQAKVIWKDFKVDIANTKFGEKLGMDLTRNLKEYEDAIENFSKKRPFQNDRLNDMYEQYINSPAINKNVVQNFDAPNWIDKLMFMQKVAEDHNRIDAGILFLATMEKAFPFEKSGLPYKDYVKLMADEAVKFSYTTQGEFSLMWRMFNEARVASNPFARPFLALMAPWSAQIQAHTNIYARGWRAAKRGEPWGKYAQQAATWIATSLMVGGYKSILGLGTGLAVLDMIAEMSDSEVKDSKILDRSFTEKLTSRLRRDIKKLGFNDKQIDKMYAAVSDGFTSAMAGVSFAWDESVGSAVPLIVTWVQQVVKDLSKDQPLLEKMTNVMVKDFLPIFAGRAIEVGRGVVEGKRPTSTMGSFTEEPYGVTDAAKRYFVGQDLQYSISKGSRWSDSFPNKDEAQRKDMADMFVGRQNVMNRVNGEEQTKSQMKIDLTNKDNKLWETWNDMWNVANDAWENKYKPNAEASAKLANVFVKENPDLFKALAYENQDAVRDVIEGRGLNLPGQFLPKANSEKLDKKKQEFLNYVKEYYQTEAMTEGLNAGFQLTPSVGNREAYNNLNEKEFYRGTVIINGQPKVAAPFNEDPSVPYNERGYYYALYKFYNKVYKTVEQSEEEQEEESNKQ